MVAAHEIRTEKLKLCIQCRKERPRDQFEDSPVREDGKWSTCRPCFEKKYPMPGRKIARGK